MSQEDTLDLTSRDDRRVSLILAELADVPYGLTCAELALSLPPEDRPSSIDQIVYRLMRDLERSRIVDRVRPRPGEYAWRYVLRWAGGPSVPKAWCSVRVPNRQATRHCKHGYDVEQTIRKYARST